MAYVIHVALRNEKDLHLNESAFVAIADPEVWFELISIYKSSVVQNRK